VSDSGRSVPSLIKWTGSKRSQARAIVAHFPAHQRYIEPFLGGGSVLFLAARPGAVAGDLYEPLVQLWTCVQDDPDHVIHAYQTQWYVLQTELDCVDPADAAGRPRFPRAYYDVRDRFNATHDPLDLSFLMRTCVNGIVRFNQRGDFNNSFHVSRRGMRPGRFARVVEAWHEVLTGVQFVCQDYEETLAVAGPGDLVYLDPPYAGNRQRYVADLGLARFFGVLEDLNSRGVRWVLSFDGRRGNSDFTVEVPPDLFERHLYLASGNSAVKRVLGGPVEEVQESLYLSF